MPDRENVIKEWEAVLSRDPLDAPWDLIDDTLALLKEQEAVEPKHNPLSPTDWFCGKCGMCISRFHDYCPSCGREVKWNA